MVLAAVAASRGGHQRGVVCASAAQPHRTGGVVSSTGGYVAEFSPHLGHVVGGSSALHPGELDSVGATVHMGCQAGGWARGCGHTGVILLFMEGVADWGGVPN